MITRYGLFKVINYGQKAPNLWSIWRVFDEVVASIKKRYQRAQKLNGQKWMKNAKMINFGIFD